MKRATIRFCLCSDNFAHTTNPDYSLGDFVALELRHVPPVPEDAFGEQVFVRESLIDSSALILYIDEGMCAGCINKELINLDEYPEIARNTIIVGNFSNKRHFLASIASVQVKRKIFIQTDEMPDVEFLVTMQPHYILYIAPSRTFELPYYPVDCSAERTYDYYRNIRSVLSAQE